MAAQNEYKPQTQVAADPAQMQKNLENQNAFVEAMKQQAAGQGPSAANELYKSAAQNQVAQANALAASQQGNINAGLATRNAQQTAAAANQQMTGQAAAQRAQEQLNAQQMLGGQSNTMMSQGMQAQQFKTGMEAGIAQQNIDSQNKLIGGITGGLMGGVGAAFGALSDERAKKDVHDGSSDIHEMLDNLSPKSYEYKDSAAPGASPGHHTSVMAQDLEKSAAGSQMVKQAPNGLKMVDYGQGLAAILAAQADLHKRLKAVESHKMAEGGEVDPNAPKAPGADMAMFAGKVLGGATKGMTGSQSSDPIVAGGTALGEGVGKMIKQSSEESALEGDMADEEIMHAHGGAIHGEMLAAQGKLVPGKPKVKGDSLQNDTVDAKLSPGEIIIPRSIAQHPDAVRKSAEFVAQVLSRKRGR